MAASERIIVFKNSGEDYSGFVAACEWCRQNGYSVGWLDGRNPVGIIKGNHLIQRWSKIGPMGKRKLDGVIEFPYGFPRLHAAVIKFK